MGSVWGEKRKLRFTDPKSFEEGAFRAIEHAKQIYDTYEELGILEEFRDWLVKEFQHRRQRWREERAKNGNS